MSEEARNSQTQAHLLGNPLGKSKNLLAGRALSEIPRPSPKGKKEMRELARSFSVDAMNQIYGLMMTGENEHVRFLAAREILSRAYGPPEKETGGNEEDRKQRLEQLKEYAEAFTKAAHRAHMQLPGMKTITPMGESVIENQPNENARADMAAGVALGLAAGALLTTEES